MPRKNKPADYVAVTTRRALRARRWNRAEVRGHQDHGTTRIVTARTEGETR